MLDALAAVIAGRPGAVLGHLQAYAELASVEAGVACKSWVKQWVWTFISVLLALLAIGLAGVAGMLVLFQATPLEPAQHWVWAPSGVVLLLAALSGVQAAALHRRMQHARHFEATRQQLATDLRMVQGWSDS